MINPEHVFASWFLWIAAASFLVCYALPLLFFPLQWARIFQWTLPEHTDLAVYFGRCVGVLATTTTIYAMRAAFEPGANRWVLEFIAMACAGMTAIHTWGAIRKVQPWTETAEIGLYGVMTALALTALHTLG